MRITAMPQWGSVSCCGKQRLHLHLSPRIYRSLLLQCWRILHRRTFILNIIHVVLVNILYKIGIVIHIYQYDASSYMYFYFFVFDPWPECLFTACILYQEINEILCDLGLQALRLPSICNLNWQTVTCSVICSLDPFADCCHHLYRPHVRQQYFRRLCVVSLPTWRRLHSQWQRLFLHLSR
jgi:hypothetical protein